MNKPDVDDLGVVVLLFALGLGVCGMMLVLAKAVQSG